MGFAFGGTQANVSISGGVTTTIPAPASTQTLVSKYVANVASGTAIHTVTAGKTFYCTGCSLSNGNVAVMGIAVDGTQINIYRTAANGGTSMSGGVLFSCPATQVISVVSDAAGNNAAIWGFEQ